jgi:hypothetical protein
VPPARWPEAEQGRGKITDLARAAVEDLREDDYGLAADLVRALIHEGADEQSEFTRGSAGAVVLLSRLRRIELLLEALVKAWS